MTSSQVQLDTICCPSGQAASEEILVFGPDWSLEHQRCCDNGPVIDIARCELLEIQIERMIYWLDQQPDLLE